MVLGKRETLKNVSFIVHYVFPVARDITAWSTTPQNAHCRRSPIPWAPRTISAPRGLRLRQYMPAPDFSVWYRRGEPFAPGQPVGTMISLIAVGHA